LKTDAANSPLPQGQQVFQYQLDASQGFGWARSAWKIFFLFWDSVILFILGFLKIKDYIVFFFTHYTLHFTNKNGARKTVREAHHQKSDAPKTTRQKWRTKSRVY